MTDPPLVVRLENECFTLANGLRVVVHEDHSVPLVAFNLWYHVGSKDESPGLTGLAHLFEHLMFEGSAHVPRGDFDRHLEGAGAINNGSTSPDRTNYWMTLPSGALEVAFWLESDRMGFFLETLSQEKLDLQRDVVRNERRQTYENRPYGLAYETLLEALYPMGHPYRHSVIGSMDDLARATLGDAQGFFRSYYAPGNASLAVAGDVTAAEALGLAERYFGEIPPGPPVPKCAPVATTAGAGGRVVLEDQVYLPRLYLAWPSAPHFTAEDADLEILAGVLSGGKTSRLYRRLVYDQKIAQDVSAFQNGGALGGAFLIVVTARPGIGLDALEAAVAEEVARLAESGVEDTERLRTLTQLESDLERGLERVGGFGGRADRLNEYLAFTGDANFLEQDLRRVREVTIGRVSAAARRLRGTPPTVVRVVPRGSGQLAGGSGPW